MTDWDDQVDNFLKREIPPDYIFTIRQTAEDTTGYLFCILLVQSQLYQVINNGLSYKSSRTFRSGTN